MTDAYVAVILAPFRAFGDYGTVARKTLRNLSEMYSNPKGDMCQ